MRPGLRAAFAATLLTLPGAGPRPTVAADEPAPADPAPLVWSENFIRAIEEVQRTGKLLLIHHTWGRGDPQPTIGFCFQALDALPTTDPDLAEEIRRHCVCLRVVVGHLGEKQPQGPSGPYRYEPNGVPLIVVKDCEGNQIVMGSCHSDTATVASVRGFAVGHIRTGISRHPPYIPPAEAARAREQLAQFRQAVEARQYRRAARILQTLQARPPEQVSWSGRADDLHPVLRELGDAPGALNEAAAALLTEAKQQEATGDLRRALPNYRKVAEEFPDDCPSVAEAAAAVARLSPGGSGAR